MDGGALTSSGARCAGAPRDDTASQRGERDSQAIKTYRNSGESTSLTPTNMSWAATRHHTTVSPLIVAFRRTLDGRARRRTWSRPWARV